MSHTRVRTTTSNRRGRRGSSQGGRRQGNQQNRNFNPSNNDNNYYEQPGHFRDDQNTDGFRSSINRSRDEVPNYSYNRGNKVKNNFKNKNSETGTSKRSHSSSSSSSSRNGTGNRFNGENYSSMEDTPYSGRMPEASRLPSHIKHPIFVNELMSRFNSMLPASNLLDPESQRPVQSRALYNNQELDHNEQSFASISNNNVQGFRIKRDKSPSSSNYRPETNQQMNRRSNDQNSHEARNRTAPTLSLNSRTSDGNGYTLGNMVNGIPQFDNPARNQQGATWTPQTGFGVVPQAGFGVAPPRGFAVDRMSNTTASRSSQSSSKTPKPTPVHHKQQPRSQNQNSNSADRRNAILKAHGFAGKQNSSNGNEPNTNSQQTGSMAASLLSQVRAFESQMNRPTVEKTGSHSRNSGNFNDSRQPSGFTRENKQPSFSSVQTNLRNFHSGNANESVNMPGSSQFTHKNVAGRTVFNIHQPVVGDQERVATRSEALRRIQDEYDVKLIEHQAKEREKEAKKREERLARYKHVDQGHRLTEHPGLSEGVEYGYDIAHRLQAEEETRQRQQEQLRRDALIYEERKKQEDEEKKKREEEKQKKRLEKINSMIDAGYKLGSGEFPVPEATPQESREDVRQRQQEQLRRAALIYEEHKRKEDEEKKTRDEEKQKMRLEKINSVVNAGYTLGSGEFPVPESVPHESREAVRLKQQEQLRQAALVHRELQGQEDGKKHKQEEEKNVNAGCKLGENEFAGSAGGAIPKVRATNPRTSGRIEAQNQKQLDPLTEVRKGDHNQSSATVTSLNQTTSRDLSGDFKLKPEKEEMKQHLLSQLEQLMAKPAKVNDTVQKPVLPEKPAQESPLNVLKLASTVQKPVLSTQEGLRKVIKPSTSSVQKPVVTTQGGLPNVIKFTTSSVQKPVMTPQEALPNVIKPSPSTVPTLILPVSRAQEGPPNVIKPASTILKNPSQGAVLVLRSSEQALHRALASRLEVQDEMDKYGESRNYIPQVEPPPLYSNNRYERKSAADIAETPATIPNTATEPSHNGASAIITKAVTSSSEPASSAASGVITKAVRTPFESASNATPDDDIVKTEEDLQAEMRAARLRMQQKYNESLKKQLENS